MDATDGAYGTSQLPLAGAVLCCTSIAPEQRAELAAIGAQMGATIKLDLTSDVTHLIVGSTDSAKYRYVAKSRDDVKVLSPAWLQVLREVWMEGHDNVHVASLERDYRLPTFFGLKICLTGFDNPEQRRYVQETVDKNGAEYHGDLTKSVTHLIAATPSGKKYEHALNWRMKIVSLEWFEQSIERGMVLDESLYNPTMPVAERGLGAWDRKQLPPTFLGKRTRSDEQVQPLNPFRRKLRRSASTKMGSQSQALWAGITAANLERPQDDEDDWTEDSLSKQDNAQANSSTVRAEDVKAQNHVALRTGGSTDDRNPPLPLSANGNSQHGIFGDCIVSPYGFDAEKTKILREHLVSHGARVISADELNNFSSDDLRRGYLVVPHDTEADLTTLPDRVGSAMNLVTNWWVERCLYGKSLVNPADHVLCRPFDKLSVSGFSGITIHSTGFGGIELLHVTKLVTLMGAIYDEQLSVKSSVMICNSPNPNAQKLKFTRDKQIPAVHATWLWDSLQSGELRPYHDYQLNALSKTHQQKPGPSIDVPTARLSEEDSFKLQQRKAQAAKTVTKVQRPQQHCAPALSPSAEATPASTTGSLTLPTASTSDADLYQSEHAIGAMDGQESFALQETTANSSRRPSTSSTDSKRFSRHRSSSAESLIKAVPALGDSKHRPKFIPESVIPTDTESLIPDHKDVPKDPEGEKDYSVILAQLRANRKAAPTPAQQEDGKRRRRRQLGRATSTRSNQSTGDSSGKIELDADDDMHSVLVDEYQPSQELGWDSPGAAKAREQMIKKLGGTIQERSVPVQGIGIVKDVVSESTGRAGRKRRG